MGAKECAWMENIIIDLPTNQPIKQATNKEATENALEPARRDESINQSQIIIIDLIIKKYNQSIKGLL